jgi:hypothetical protein
MELIAQGRVSLGLVLDLARLYPFVRWVEEKEVARIAVTLDCVGPLG